MPRGNQRGTGRVAVIPAVELTQAELLPFAVGKRLADHIATPREGEAVELAPVYVRMSTAERRELLTLDRGHVDKWIMIGAMQASIEWAIATARGD